VEQAKPAEAPAQEAAAKPAEEVKFDLTAAVSNYLSNIPEGFMAVAKVEDFKSLLDSGEVVLVDVREAKEYGEGHFPGAINIPIRTVADNLDKIPMDKPVIVYCASGHRAGMATTALRLLGYDNVKAGPTYKAWTEAKEASSTDAVEATTYKAPQVQPELLAAVKSFLSGIPEGWLAMGDIEKFKEAIANGAFLVDVREPGDYEKGHLPDAVNSPIRTLGQNLDKIPHDKPVFVYCASGHRAALSTAALQMLGYTNVRSFPPGFPGWSKAGEPTAMVQ
jgi:rhodanese-related sulfurtransferase